MDDERTCPAQPPADTPDSELSPDVSVTFPDGKRIDLNLSIPEYIVIGAIIIILTIILDVSF